MLFTSSKLSEAQEEALANKLTEDWRKEFEFRFVSFKAEMDTPFWHLIMKDLMDRTFGPLK